MARRHPLLSRREFAVIAGAGATALVLGEGIIAADRAVAGGHPFQTGPLTAQPDAIEAEAHASPAAESQRDASPQPATEPRPATLEELPWNLRLVNGEHPLPDDFALPAMADVPDGDLAIDARAAEDLTALLADAEAAGVRPVVVSAYRTRDYQAELFRDRVRRAEREEGLTGEEAEDAAAFWVARPGTSEHEAALAVDLADVGYQELDERQEKTDTQQWLMAHCTEYGFILRYPTDKSATTGIGYEPWHYRYVGKEAASDIAESGLCLEEWLTETYHVQA